MPFNGTGTYNPPAPEFPAVSGTVILASDFNAIIADIAAALSECITSDGQSGITANINFGGNRIVQLAPGINPQDAVNMLQAFTDPVFTATTVQGVKVQGTAFTVNVASADFTTSQMFVFTQVAGDNTTKVASTAFVHKEVLDLNTVLSQALADEIQDRLDAEALLAPLASPALTGVPTAPTAAPGTVGTQLATVQYVLNQAFTQYPPQIERIVRTSNVQLTSANISNQLDLAGTFTQTLDAAATMGTGWHVWLRNASNGDITLDPTGAELIGGASTYVLKPGYLILLTCDGSAFDVLELKTRTYPNCIQYTSSSAFVVPADTYVLRGYAFGAGADGTTTASGAGGGCAFGDIPVTPGETVTFDITGGVATVISQSITRMTGNPASGVTAGTASKHASVTNGGAYAGGTGWANATAAGGSSGSPLGVGAGPSQSGGAGWGGVGGNTRGHGGGVGGAVVDVRRSGPGLSVPSIDPLLFGLVGLGQFAVGETGAPGCGGCGCSTDFGGLGGFGGGGGGTTAAAATGGAGGFGGGGGAANNTSGVGGAGGLGGGGGRGAATGGAGGGAVIRIYY